MQQYVHMIPKTGGGAKKTTILQLFDNYFLQIVVRRKRNKYGHLRGGVQLLQLFCLYCHNF